MFKATICCVLALAFAPAVEASVSSIAFETPNLTQADASPTGNINTATTFSLQDLGSTNNTSGVFAGLPIEDFGTVVFSPGKGASLVIKDAAFGTFKSVSFTVEQNSAGFLNLLDTGVWIPGTFASGVTSCATGCASVMRINFNQTPPMQGQIAFSGTMSITQPVSVVPEPPTALLLLSGAGLMLAGSKLRKVLP